MNLPFNIAKRYLFAKKSTNAINIITGISVFGIAVQTAAFILVLSVFNGFEDLLIGLFSNFNPEVKVTPLKGKTFSTDSIDLLALQQIEGIEYISQTLEELSFFEYRGNQVFGKLKGVDTNFVKVSSIDSTIREGVYATQLAEMSFAILGVGMQNKLRVDLNDDFTTIEVYIPKDGQVGTLSQPFRKLSLYPIGAFAFQQDFDQQYVITNLNFVQRLLESPNQISALEIKLKTEKSSKDVITQIKNVLGKDFKVQNRYEQDETFLKLINIEKWLSFAILTLTLLLLAFNLIGSLWMIVLEKQKDIAILQSMGMYRTTIRNIFLYEGLLICSFGLIIGFAVALVFFVLQKAYGIIPIPEGFVVDAYPISIRPLDFLVVIVVVFSIGLLASFPAAYRAQRLNAIVRQD
jgi:lipoprotein-releasing system permease protein